MPIDAPETQVVTTWKVACDGGEGALGAGADAAAGVGGKAPSSPLPRVKRPATSQPPAAHTRSLHATARAAKKPPRKAASAIDHGNPAAAQLSAGPAVQWHATAGQVSAQAGHPVTRCATDAPMALQVADHALAAKKVGCITCTSS